MKTGKTMKRQVLLTVLLLTFTVLSQAQEKADALVLYRQGQFAQAVEVCIQELQVLKPEQTRLRMDSYSVMGWSYLRLNQFENALKSARTARNEVRYDVRLIEIEAEALYFLGRNTEALPLFEEYVSLSPTGERISLVYYFMGEIFLRLAEYRHADIAFSTAIHHSPQTAAWWARLGYAREQIGDKTGAEAAYSTALKLQPALEEARVGLERVRKT
jgi:Flp pilus assembly protein TadD